MMQIGAFQGRYGEGRGRVWAWAPCAAAWLLLWGGWVPAHGQPMARIGALNALGTTGGLSIPDASSLGSGSMAFGLSDAREPQLGPAQKPRSALLGIGLLPGLDVVGRVAEYG